MNSQTHQRRAYRRAAATTVVAVLGLAALTACSSGKSVVGAAAAGDPAAPLADSTKVTISIDCEPPTSTPIPRANWLGDVTAFEKLHPNITVKSISAGAQCDNPPDFTARLKGGTEADVFYGYMTDTSAVLNTGQAADISPYINDTIIPNWESVDTASKSTGASAGKTYGIPIGNYSMGLVYNTKLFTQAGLDPTKPPKTWDDVAADAARIAALGNGTYGYGDYSAGNTGGWHFTTELYAQGGSMVSADGKSAAFNDARGIQVVKNLETMAAAHSVGTKQLLGWADLLTLAAGDKVGMYLGAPDTVTAMVQNFKGSYADWAMAPMPGQTAAGTATLGGGSLYFFKKTDTPDQIKAGLMFVAYEKLTVGQGLLNFVQQHDPAQNTPVGLPEPLMFNAGTDSAKALAALGAANANLPQGNFAAFAANPVPLKVEPPDAQQIYAVLDSVMASALTDPTSDPAALLATATTKVNAILAANQ